MEQRIERLERQLRFLRLYALAATLFVGGLIMTSFSNQAEQIIRTRGIIIEDAQGKERILIGAPIPYAANRVRTDTARARKEWSRYFSADYMKWYKDYDHRCNGMIILDENGFDRITLGSPTPDPNIGKRIGPSTGIEINDERGFERTGYGVLNVRGKNRVVLGLDSERGTEGAYFVLMENGTTDIGIKHNEHQMFLGSTREKDFTTGMSDPFFGLLMRDTAGVHYNLNQLEKSDKK